LGQANIPRTTIMETALLLVAMAPLLAQGDLYKEFLKGIDMYNFRAKCWGEKNIDLLVAGAEAAKEKCMTMESHLLQPRSKRQVEELAELGETVEEFVQQYGDFQEDWAVKMGNLSCVLVEIQWLKEDMTVNMDFWTTALTGPAVEGGFEFDVEGAAATDPIWRQKLSEANQECHDLSEAWPAAQLSKDPITMFLGRPNIFFKCYNKAERKLCAEAEMLQWLEKIYGQTQPETLQQLGLPQNKYDAAGIAAAVLSLATPKEGKFVDEFMWQQEDEM